MMSDERLKKAQEIVDAFIRWNDNDDPNIDDGCSGYEVNEEGLRFAIYEALPDKTRCPCGGIILADTEDCKVPMCIECAIEIRKCMTETPSDEEITNMAIVRADEALGECKNPRLCYIRGLNYGARWAIKMMTGNSGE